jgi:hypothetical protein
VLCSSRVTAISNSFYCLRAFPLAQLIPIHHHGNVGHSPIRLANLLGFYLAIWRMRVPLLTPILFS